MKMIHDTVSKAVVEAQGLIKHSVLFLIWKLWFGLEAVEVFNFQVKLDLEKNVLEEVMFVNFVLDRRPEKL